MEWQKNGLNQNANAGTMRVNVMTDEQIETLRKQIAVYTVISQQLIETHKTLSSQQDLTLTGGSTRLSMYCDPLINKISSRQRWIPTPVQLQTLERIFEAETGTPSKEKVKEITADLTKHGQISETSVYNWFQNRRARSKRKEPNNVNDVPEVETEVNSGDKKIEQDEIVRSQPSESLCRQSSNVFSDLADLNPESGDNLRPSRNFDQGVATILLEKWKRMRANMESENSQVIYNSYMDT